MFRYTKALVLMLAALLLSTAALAQETLDETFDNGLFAVDYASGWILDAFVSEDEDGNTRPIVFLYSSTAVQDAVTGGGDPVVPAGEAVVYLTSNDDGMLTAQAAMDEFIAEEEAAGSALGTVSEFETSGYEGYIVSLEAASGDGFAGVLGSRELRITFVTLAARGELADYEETFEAIIDSIRPSGEEADAEDSDSDSDASGTDGDALTLDYGESAVGLMQDDDGDVWTFEGQEGDVISISMTAQALDSYLEVYDPSGDLIEEDDDSGDALNALIEALELEANGTHTIVARTFAGAGRGAYELTLTEAGGSARGGTALTADTNTQSEVEGNLPLGETQTYTFAGSAGQVVTILLESDALSMDPFLNLYTSDREIILQDDDSAGELNAIIENFALPADDTYTIEVTTAYGDGGGEYRLTLVGAALDDAAVGSATVSGDMIEIGDTVTGNLPLGESLDYTFVGEAGDEVTIELVSDQLTFDPYLELRSADGDVLAEDDDSAGGLNALIEDFELPEDGEYRIVVRTFARAGGGEYTLTLR